jgi:hypothetical protein
MSSGIAFALASFQTQHPEREESTMKNMTTMALLLLNLCACGALQAEDSFSWAFSHHEMSRPVQPVQFEQIPLAQPGMKGRRVHKGFNPGQAPIFVQQPQAPFQQQPQYIQQPIQQMPYPQSEQSFSMSVQASGNDGYPGVAPLRPDGLDY